MEYINYVRNKVHAGTSRKPPTPVLSEEDERFLNRVISQEDESPLPLPARPRVQDLPVAGETHDNDAQIALMDGAQNIALPRTPDETRSEPEAAPLPLSDTDISSEKKPARKTWSWLRRDSRDLKQQHQTSTAESPMDVADGMKSPDAKPNEENVVSDVEAKKEQEDMAIVLEKLNLAAVNNRVFSISDETQELLRRFNQVFKDLVNGVPTAYDDLESLLTNGDKQLQKTFNHLPSFLQKLIAQLPNRMKETIAPELIAAATARAEKSGSDNRNAENAADATRKRGFKTPALKDLVKKPGAIAAMMRSIITFLRARFPAFLGMNVLWSLALFVLLFVFWYCHKRGREVRLEHEKQLMEKETARLGNEDDATNLTEGHITTETGDTPSAAVQ